MPKIHVNIGFYKAFGLPNFASIDDVKKKYRSLALAHHPDRTNGGDDTKMKEINHIYEVLTKFKRDYDRWLHRMLDPRPIPVMRVEVVWGQWPSNLGTSNSGTTAMFY